MRHLSAVFSVRSPRKKILSALAAIFAGGVVTCVAAEPDKTLPQTRVQIVNATSVPEIALSINGKKSYPNFRQGLYTADGPTDQIEVEYTAQVSGKILVAKSQKIQFAPNRIQTVVILGDFSTEVPPEQLPTSDSKSSPPKKPYPPNVFFRVYSHDQSEPPSAPRLRVINGMPGKTLVFGSYGKPQIKFILKPGGEKELWDQPPTAEYFVKIDGKTDDVLMRQEGLIRNAMLILYLDKEGQPKFKRVFENQ